MYLCLRVQHVHDKKYIPGSAKHSGVFFLGKWALVEKIFGNIGDQLPYLLVVFLSNRVDSGWLGRGVLFQFRITREGYGGERLGNIHIHCVAARFYYLRARQRLGF